MNQQAIDFYPVSAGAKVRTGPSREAAQAVTRDSKRERTQRLIVSSLTTDGPATADELADRLKLDRLYVRPRVSEMRKLRQIVDTGKRRRNDGGRSATVWGIA